VSPALDEGGESLALPGFLFDMNRFFQRLVARFLRENLVGCKVEEEQSLREMMRYAPGENPQGRRAPRPRPDFAVTAENGTRTLLDAKYRDLWVRDLPREMLYQLAMYALSQRAGGRATIIYPTPTKGALPARIEIQDATYGWARGSVVLQPLELENLAELITGGVDQAAATARAALARRIAFGAPVVAGPTLALV
jgi:5-methylcytosine-specific restriction enzyme subunit McrC